MARQSIAPFGVDGYDNPETIRFKKYATGAHIMLQGTGVETGQTPKEVVWEKGKAKLYRYEPDAEKRFPVPVLLVYALILRPYILDLVPGNSFVEYLVGEGFDVYMLDWGVPGSEDRHLSFENYVLDYMPEAVEQVSSSSQAEELTLFGYCQGGTIAAMYASLFPDKPLKNLVLLATPVDFALEDPGLFGLWTIWSRNSETFLDPNLVVEAFGNVPADLPTRLMEAGIGTLRPLVGPYANLWDRIRQNDEALNTFLAVSKWVDDGIPFPGKAFRQWIRDFYQHNKLVKGELQLRQRPVDLSNIECPVLNIAGKKDFICPLPQAEGAMDLLSSQDKEFLAMDAGHIGLMASSVARNELWPRVRDWLEPRSR
ncbi:MAG: alpha/beta fold hydrolase [Actinomycetota bacterium]|nr:alpha/beta fold hydrolase [Actinomycetota bacterium]